MTKASKGRESARSTSALWLLLLLWPLVFFAGSCMRDVCVLRIGVCRCNSDTPARARARARRGMGSAGAERWTAGSGAGKQGQRRHRSPPPPARTRARQDARDAVLGDAQPVVQRGGPREAVCVVFELWIGFGFGGCCQAGIRCLERRRARGPLATLPLPSLFAPPATCPHQRRSLTAATAARR